MANSSYITLLKQKVINEIIDDPLIVQAFGSPDYQEAEPGQSSEDVRENYIFTWRQGPGIMAQPVTFLTIQVSIQRSVSNWVTPKLRLTVYSHRDHIKLTAGDFPGVSANRNDYLSALLDQKFNGRESLGLPDDPDKLNLMGELILTASHEGACDDIFAYRTMIFETKDINHPLCSARG